MVCVSPLQGYESNELTAKGKRKTTLNRYNARRHGFLSERVVSCNRCVGCRFDYSRQWAIRCMHEASLYESNSFITLTYNDRFLPRIYSDNGHILGYGSLNYDHWTKFMKRLRKALAPLRVRFYMGPEYGDINFRPHFHAIIFNYDFPDKTVFKVRNGLPLYRSLLLERLWTDPDSGESMGFCSVGTVTFRSAAYVARYMMKKVKGEDIEDRYKRFNLETGEIFFVEPEKARMSNQNGIGKDWFDLYYRSDLYNKDFVTMDGVKYRPPKYYDSLFEKICPQDLEDIKLVRQEAMRKLSDSLTPDRLRQVETCLLSDSRKLPRNIYQSLEV